LLKEKGIEYRYREYTKEPLSADELRSVLAMLGVPAKAVLRGRDAKKEGLTGDESEDTLVAAMAANPNLLQRPIFVLDGKAVVGRPVERLDEIL
jgi:arsenate reductase (glutaredoxin)